jgi:hypothetical protein
METIIKPRRGGKTLELIKRVDDHNGYIVCINMIECERVFRFAQKSGFNINMPVTWADFLNGKFRGYRGGMIYFDNIDLMLQNSTGATIGGVTLTKNL